MSRMVFCQVLKQQAEGLERPPHPGEIGQRVYENVSKEGWRKWLERLSAIINENKLNTADPGSILIIEKHMVGFLFGDGDLGAVPEGFRPPGQKK